MEQPKDDPQLARLCLCPAYIATRCPLSISYVCHWTTVMPATTSSGSAVAEKPNNTSSNALHSRKSSLLLLYRLTVLLYTWRWLFSFFRFWPRITLNGLERTFEVTDNYSASALFAMQTAVIRTVSQSVCLSVCLSVSVTFRLRCFVQMNEHTIVRSSA